MRQRGFTLVELTIVLVIIALVMAGVIKGVSLINAAKTKDVLAIDTDLRNAIALFNKRFGYLPGDWPYQNNVIDGVVASTTSGTNGNGVIEGNIDAEGKAVLGSEVAELPLQLYGAGMLGKINLGEPQRRLSTSFGPVHVVSKLAADALVSGFIAANPTARHAIVFSSLPCEVANDVDASLDNASLASGRAVGICVGTTVAWYAIAL